MEPKIKTGYQSTSHRDGTVSYWDVYTQGWDRVHADGISDSILSSMSDVERRRIARMQEVSQ
jgi:hypothetical protein